MPRFQNWESLSRGTSRYMLHVEKQWKIFGLSTTTSIQHRSVSLYKMCYCFGCFSSWHIRSRMMIAEEQCMFRFPELTCSCFIAMVTYVSVAQSLTSAFLTCHKHMSPLTPNRNLSKRLLCSSSEIPDTHKTLPVLCDIISEWKQKWKLQRMADCSQQEFPSSCGGGLRQGCWKSVGAGGAKRRWVYNSRFLHLLGW